MLTLLISVGATMRVKMHYMSLLAEANTIFAKELIEIGIEINARGDLGRTPLHEAASSGDLQIVKLLVESGADVYALTEGYPPFTLARFSKKNDVCDYLSEEMKKAQSKNSAAWAKAQIEYLKREISRIEKQYGL
jgi:ankyrin repeat protein